MPSSFDAVAQLLGVLDVGGGQLGNAFHIGLVKLHRNAKGNRAHQGRLVRGVHAFDVKGGVGLGIAQTLGFLQNNVKVRPLSRISDRMKLVVPLMMPATHWMELAVRPSRSALMMGMPPATAAS